MLNITGKAGSCTETNSSERSLYGCVGECDCCVHTGPNKLHLHLEFNRADLNNSSMKTSQKSNNALTWNDSRTYEVTMVKGHGCRLVKYDSDSL